MTQDHGNQDTPAIAPAKGAPPQVADWPRQRLRVLILGLNAWFIAGLWPAVGGRWTVAMLLPPVALLAGALLLGRERPWPGLPPALRDALPTALLLALFPALIALTVAAHPAPTNHRALGPLALSLLVLSMLAYGALVASLDGAGLREVQADHAPLAERQHPHGGGPRARLRTLYIALVLGGAFAIGVVAPVLGGLSPLERAWGDAAMEGGLLTAVVAAAIAAGIAAISLGDALRSTPRPRALPDERNVRVATLLFLTLLGAVTYFVVIWQPTN